MALFETTKSPSQFASQFLFKLHINPKINAFVRHFRKFPYLWFCIELSLCAQSRLTVMPLSNWQMLRFGENLICLKLNSLPSLHSTSFSIQSTYLPSLSHDKSSSCLPLVSLSPISHKALSLVSQKCLGTLLFFRSPCLPLTCIICPRSAFLPLVSLFYGNSLKCRSDYLFLTLKVWLATL